MSSQLRVNELQNLNGTSGMTIDTSGRISEPNKPSVTLMISNTGYVNVTNNNAIPFNLVQYSQGGGDAAFDTSNYHFTCPLSGIYAWTFSALVGSSETNLDVTLKNGSESVHRFFQSNNRGLAASGVIVATAGDVLQYVNSVGATRGFYGSGGGQSDRYTFASFVFLG
jgi:hypothetical protein